tara:strand:- start:767 stop:889 length:123 start_codon:yes stop_codon:yes gene_type:complete
MTAEEIYMILGVLSALQEKQNQDQETLERRNNNSSGWRGM